MIKRIAALIAAGLGVAYFLSRDRKQNDYSDYAATNEDDHRSGGDEQFTSSPHGRRGYPQCPWEKMSFRFSLYSCDGLGSHVWPMCVSA